VGKQGDGGCNPNNGNGESKMDLRGREGEGVESPARLVKRRVD
jgi:hypothetical protein